HLTHEDVVDLVGGHPGSQERLRDGEPTQVHGREPGQRAGKLPDRGTSPCDDDGLSHSLYLRVPAGLVTSRKPHLTGQLSSGHMSDILSAALAGATPDELAGLPIPDSYRGALVKRSEVDMFEGMESSDKDPRRSLHVEEVPLPELA